jgi:hypothetical protein
MITHIIRDLGIIRKLTGKENHKLILLHLNHDKREAKYQSDYTLFELTEALNYNDVIQIIA